MKGLLVALILAIAVPAAAQEPTPLRWPAEHRALAGHISDGIVAGQVLVDTVHSFRSADRSGAFTCQAIRLGFTIGVAELTKRLVQRTRPDASDRKSFFSEHTAIAMASAGWRYEIGIPVAFGAGYFRMAANKHYATDVLAGAAVGYFSHTVGPCE